MTTPISTHILPGRSEWKRLMERGVADTAAVRETVAGIMAAVRSRGDEALLDYERRFDCPTLSALRVGADEIDEAARSIPRALADAMATAKANIEKFHAAQRPRPVETETTEGVVCRQKAVAIGNVGLYIPGGNSPLFSTVLMLATPARIAGCRRVVLCTPPDREGRVHPAILAAARLTGVDEIYKAGGAQAIAAMACGTATIPKVDKIFGPGNRFVMEAKQQAGADGVAIDMPAGPSEVMIVADRHANPVFVAADFLSQAEHGPDSQSVLLTDSQELAAAVAEEIGALLQTLPRKEMIGSSLSHSRIIVLPGTDEIMAFANEYAPEHLIINHAAAGRLAEMVENAGSVFLGPYACESAGDYASGTNHTLPTSGYAHAYSGVNLDSFMKKITFQTISREGIAALGPVIETLAEAEDLMAHKLAATVRIAEAKSK